MIDSRSTLKQYIRQDLSAHQVHKLSLYRYWFDDCLRFQIRLRRIEWLYNTSSKWSPRRAACIALQIINHRLGTRLGFTIPKNVFGPGLCIVHYGTIVVSPLAKVGSNCRIHPSTSIGDYNGAPTLGDNVYIGPGAKLYGAITIGDNVAIGANAVVNKSFGSNVVLGGVPATVIKTCSSLDIGVFPDTIAHPSGEL